MHPCSHEFEKYTTLWAKKKTPCVEFRVYFFPFFNQPSTDMRSTLSVQIRRDSRWYKYVLQMDSGLEPMDIWNAMVCASANVLLTTLGDAQKKRPRV